MAEANIEFWYRFINSFCLYTKECNPNKKYDCYWQMWFKLQEMKPNATEENVKEVMLDLRIAYHIELKKLAESKELESESKDLYKPLWFFHYLNFLEKPKINRVVFAWIDECTLENIEVVTPNNSTSSNTETEVDNLSKCLSNQVISDNQPLNTPAGVWEAEYRRLDAAQQLLALSVVSEILHQGALGHLSEHSHTKFGPEAPNLALNQLKVPATNIKFWSEFIDILEICPALWDQSYDSDYDYLLECGHKMLVEKLREIDPKVVVEDVKDLILTIRISYRKELIKLAKSKKPGRKSKDVYKPLWFFYKLYFLEDQESGKLVMPSIYDCALGKGKSKVSMDSKNIVVTPNNSTSSNTKTVENNVSKCLSNQIISDNLLLNTPVGAWEAQYRRLDAAQQVFAHRCITKVLHQGSLGQIKTSSLVDLNPGMKLFVPE